VCITDCFRVLDYIFDEVVLCAFHESTISMLVSA